MHYASWDLKQILKQMRKKHAGSDSCAGGEYKTKDFCFSNQYNTF